MKAIFVAALLSLAAAGAYGEKGRGETGGAVAAFGKKAYGAFAAPSPPPPAHLARSSEAS